MAVSGRLRMAFDKDIYQMSEEPVCLLSFPAPLRLRIGPSAGEGKAGVNAEAAEAAV